MEKMPQIQKRAGQIFPSPRQDEIMLETPPAFGWREEEGVENYRLIIRKAGESAPCWQGETERTFLVPDAILPPGCYEWNLMGGGMERGWQAFSIADNAVEFLRPRAEDIFEAVPADRPRMIFFKEDIPSILEKKQGALNTLRRNIAWALKEDMPMPPQYHRDETALPYREYFGRHRDFCDRDLVACALGYWLLEDEKAGAHAKELLLTLCDWNSEGPCSLEGPWGDEIGLSHARCLPAVFDLCFDLLSEKERLFVARTVAHYAEQCERRLMKLNFCQNPGDSHAGRLPAYLGEAAMALKGTGVRSDETLKRWLTYAIDIYGGIFPYFGAPDGGWAEGTFYSSSYTKWFLPFFMAVERFAGISFLKRPFYQRFCRYLQHFCPPGWEIHPFGDGYWCKSDDAEWPGFFAQNPYHIYAERFGGKLLKKWSRNAQEQEIFKLHLLDVFLPEGEAEENSLAGEESRACAFPDTGYVSLHTDPAHPGTETALVARSSPYGSISHQHADQGNFALFHGGTALIAPSGYFGRAYGTKHHMEWTNQTPAHNTILVDGQGQESFSFRAVGKVLYARDEGDILTGVVDPSGAYEKIEAWERKFILSEQELIVEDRISLYEPGEITWLLHALSEPRITENGMQLTRKGVKLEIVPEEGELSRPAVADDFAVPLNEGVPEDYQVSMPQQYHMQWKTPRKKEHFIRVRFRIG